MTGLLSLGYLGMFGLLSYRPQFIAWGLTPFTQVVHQASPIVTTRPVSAPDTEYKVKGATTAHITYKLQSNEDWRGLKGARSLAGTFEGEFHVLNTSSDDEFLAFKLPFPTRSNKNDWQPLTQQAIGAKKFEVQGAPDGEIQTTSAGWFWSGVLPAGDEAIFHLIYDTGNLSKGTYGLSKDTVAAPGEHHIAVSLDRDVPMSILGGQENGKRVDQDNYTWEQPLRSNGVPQGFSLRPGFSVLDALTRLLQLAPLVTGMYLVTLLSLLTAKRKSNATELVLLALVFGYYFPLVTYLCARYPLPQSIGIAFIASAAIMLNYLRFLVGNRRSVIHGLLLLLLFQVTPTVLAFQQWERGLVLLILGGVALLAIVNMQTARLKQSGPAAAALLLGLMTMQPESQAASIQNSKGQTWETLWQATQTPTSPAEDAPKPGDKPDPSSEVVGERRLITSLATYEMTLGKSYLESTVQASVEVLGESLSTCEVMPGGAYISRMDLPKFLRPLPEKKSLTLLLTAAGTGRLALDYRCPIEKLGEARSCTLPLLKTISGKLTMHSTRDDLLFYGGEVWSKKTTGKATVYRVGVADSNFLTIRWGGPPVLDSEEDPPHMTPGAAHIQVVQSQHLTLIQKERRVSHFARFVLAERHRLRSLDLHLPADFEIVSLVAQGFSVTPPAITSGLCHIPLGASTNSPSSREIQLHLRKKLAPIGFTGNWEFLLPRTSETEGAIQWTLAGPSNFRLENQSSDLNASSTDPPLAFPSYRALLAVCDPIHLEGTVISQGELKAHVRYVQEIPHVTDGVN